MSKEIDFEFGRSIGATHYFLGDHLHYFLWVKIDGESLYGSIDDRWVEWSNVHNRRVAPIPSQWTIHNNTLQLRELSDEQYGKLRRAADAGGVVELLLVGGEWCNAEPNWCDDLVYRIKPKSEREVFVERCHAAAGQEPLTTGMSFKEAYGRLFDAGCRFSESDK